MSALRHHVTRPGIGLALAAAFAPRPDAHATFAVRDQRETRAVGGCPVRVVGLAGARAMRRAAFAVRVRGSRVVVQRDGRSGEFLLTGDVDPPYAACVRVADARPRGDTTYVLLHAFGDSRSRPARGECSGGSEERLLWFAVGPWRGRDVRPDRREAVNIGSCLYRVESDDQPDFTGEQLHVRFTTYAGGGTADSIVTYDRRAPERGLVVTGAPSGNSSR